MSARSGFSLPGLALAWAAGNTIAGAATGLAVGVLRGDTDRTILLVSVVFANIVGFTALLGSVTLSPRLRRLPTAARVALLGIALLSASAAGTLVALYLFPLFVLADPRQAFALVAINSVLALVVGGVAYAYEGMRWRLAETLREVEEVRLVEANLREQAARAELTALQARINPHFLFNTLNTIAALLAEDPERAEAIVQSLADLFRYTFKAASSGPVTLGEELDFVRGYLAVESARFGDRLRVAWDVETPARGAMVPGLILQPLVENAVGHGIGPVPGGGTVRISARADDGRLIVEVLDDGSGLAAEPESLIREDHALGNVRRRLTTLYGAEAHFTLANSPGGRGALARIALPLSVPARVREVGR